MEVQYRVSVKRALCLPNSFFKPLPRWYTMYIANRDINPGSVVVMHCCKAPLWVCTANRDINPGFVGAMHCCKAPLWGRCLDLDTLNLAPRFKRRLLLLL